MWTGSCYDGRDACLGAFLQDSGQRRGVPDGADVLANGTRNHEDGAISPYAQNAETH